MNIWTFFDRHFLALFCLTSFISFLLFLSWMAWTAKGRKLP